MEVKESAYWSGHTRILFKFIFIYLILYALPLQVLYQDLVIWFGNNIIGIGEEIRTDATGSGDMLYQWLTFSVHLLIASVGTIIWTVIDRNRISYHKLAEGLYILSRYYLAIVMLGYGIGKVIPTQFPEPNLIRLTQEYGDSSPMGLAWTFLGYSTGYQIFAGVMETVGGLLLLFRRTTLIGALVLIAVLTNVLMINLSLDVPVKLFSAHLLLIAIGLASLQLKPLWDFVVMKREAKLHSRPLPVRDRGWRIIIQTVKGIFIGGIILVQIYFFYNQYDSRPDSPEIAGVYIAQEFELNGVSIDPLLTDSTRWHRVVIDDLYAGQVAIDYMTGDRVRFSSEISSETNSMSGEVPVNPLYEDGSGNQLNAVWERPSEMELILQGTLGEDSLYVRMEKREMDDILLISRGFNWVNEVPFNR